MASHGILRASATKDRSEEARQKELREIQAYQSLVEEVNAKVDAREFTPELLQRTAELLKKNPEYYTIWNHRRRIYANEFNNLNSDAVAGKITEDTRISNVLDIIQLDLQFLFPLLLKFPKCYWIWNHRLWLLEQSTKLLPSEKSRALWIEELSLVDKMLSRDSRNFHGWGYRRTVIQNIESPELSGSSMSRQEFVYTTKMIGMNLSNFSAWHNRSKLIIRMLEEEEASDEERKEMLEDELRFIHQALFDPYDQSLWFYHQNLMCSFDPELADRTMAPHLSNSERHEFIMAEQAFVEEVLEDAADCKWVYQALVELALLEAKLGGGKSDSVRGRVTAWIEKLEALDPLRHGRWEDLRRSISTSAS